MTVSTEPISLARAALRRAYKRAVAEGLMAYPQADGRWTCKHYHLVLTGPEPEDVACDCADAIFRERICKHAACLVFYRVYGVIACPPIATTRAPRLPDCVDDFLARLEEISPAA